MSNQSLALTIWLVILAGSLIRLVRSRSPWVATIAVLAGWLLLPVADYPAPFDRSLHSRWGIGQFLLASEIATRLCWVSAASIVVTLMTWFVDRAAIPRPCLIDAVVVGVPVIAAVSAGAAGGTPAWIGTQSGYLVVTWGGLWTLGRTLAHAKPQQPSGTKIAGILACLLLAASLVEFLTGPLLYRVLYGVHPFSDEGHERYVLNRPLLFFEDGNQYGLAVTMLGVAAVVWLAFRRGSGAPSSSRRSAGFHVAAVFAIVVALLSQSRGAILLAAGSLAVLGLRRWRWMRATLIAAAGVAVLLGTLHISGVVTAERLVNGTAAGQQLKTRLKAAGLGSFGWRVGHSERYFPMLRKKLWLGYGQANWWQQHSQEDPLTTEVVLRDAEAAQRDRPWPFVVLIAGAYGVTGLVLTISVLAVPAIRAITRWLRHPHDQADMISMGIALVLLMQIGDLFLNSTLLPTSVVLAGYLASRDGCWLIGGENLGRRLTLPHADP